MTLKDAIDIITALFLKPGDTITRAQMAKDRAIVSAAFAWWVFKVEPDNGLGFSLDGYELFLVRPGENHHVVVHGVARLPDGTMFDLKDAAQFRSFYEAARSKIAPTDVAMLLLRYQGDHKPSTYVGLIVTLDDLKKQLTPEQVRSVPELIPFQVSQSDNGHTALEFCTFAQDSLSRFTLGPVRIARWRVEEDPDKGLTWSFRTIADALPALPDEDP